MTCATFCRLYIIKPVGRTAGLAQMQVRLTPKAHLGYRWNRAFPSHSGGSSSFSLVSLENHSQSASQRVSLSLEHHPKELVGSYDQATRSWSYEPLLLESWEALYHSHPQKYQYPITSWDLMRLLSVVWSLKESMGGIHFAFKWPKSFQHQPANFLRRGTLSRSKSTPSLLRSPKSLSAGNWAAGKTPLGRLQRICQNCSIPTAIAASYGSVPQNSQPKPFKPS